MADWLADWLPSDWRYDVFTVRFIMTRIRCASKVSVPSIMNRSVADVDGRKGMYIQECVSRWVRLVPLVLMIDIDLH